MKKILILFVPKASIFVLFVLIGTYFIEDIHTLFQLGRTNSSSLIPAADIQILLCFGFIGLVGIFRKRSNKNFSS
jgi:hypothetical protein